ncbi:MAG: ATP-binding protein [Desulfocapsaceae bacterium]|nr:ATP-binding protein [Desulfocapsaceae bacterium]
MKIEHKIYLSNSIHILLIVLIGLVALQNLNDILTKFRFTVIAEGLNATFLEMRLAEKNYFFYGDVETFNNIQSRIDQTNATLLEVRPDIIRAVGSAKFTKLQDYLHVYAQLIDSIRKENHRDVAAQKKLREAGQDLKTFSEDITALEIESIGALIVRSKNILRVSFLAVVLFAFLFSNLIVRNIGKSLRKVISLTRAISRGNYPKIKEQPSHDEMGEVINAINAMAEGLHNREKEIIQSKRLASIGVLVAGVAHELNNPLNNISMIAQTYTEVYDGLSKEQRIDFMEQIDEETERLRLIIHNLLDYAKPKEQHLSRADTNQVIKKTLSLVQNMLNISNIKITLALAEDLPDIYIDEHQIQQVLVNMATNAIQAMDQGGELRITTRYLPDDEKIEIEIGDNGKGIAPEFLDHIFDPFFTTKEEKGTGLGLWVSFGIIKNHQGNIRVTSQTGIGTTFTISLPSCHKLGVANC